MILSFYLFILFMYILISTEFSRQRRPERRTEVVSRLLDENISKHVLRLVQIQ